MKRALAGVSLVEDMLSFSFAKQKGDTITPLLDFTRHIPNVNVKLGQFIKEYIDDIENEIRTSEKKYSFRADKIYFTLPREYARMIIAHDVVSFDTRTHQKRVTQRDIDAAKKRIEDISLSWDDVPLHHLVLTYEVEGKRYAQAPLGVWARKMKVKSCIIAVKNTLQEEFVQLFDNINRRFGGFIYEGLSDYGVFASCAKEDLCILHIKGDKTTVTSLAASSPVWEEEFSFGEKTLIAGLMRQYSVSSELAHQLIFRYGSYALVEPSKEISIKEGSNYIQLAAMSLNSFLREFTLQHITKIIKSIQRTLDKSSITVSFLGRLSLIDGFYDYMSQNCPGLLHMPKDTRTPQSAFGCLRYGVFRFLEKGALCESPLRRALRIYREYF